MILPDDVRAGMRATNDLFCSRVVRLRDIEALDSIYTPDAHILPPGSELIEGIDAIKQFWSHAIAELDIKDSSLVTVSAEAAGDSVVEIGRAELTPADGQKIAVKYVVHWKRDGAAWKWHTDIWNMNH